MNETILDRIDKIIETIDNDILEFSIDWLGRNKIKIENLKRDVEKFKNNTDKFWLFFYNDASLKYRIKSDIDMLNDYFDFTLSKLNYPFASKEYTDDVINTYKEFKVIESQFIN